MMDTWFNLSLCLVGERSVCVGLGWFGLPT